MGQNSTNQQRIDFAKGTLQNMRGGVQGEAQIAFLRSIFTQENIPGDTNNLGATSHRMPASVTFNTDGVQRFTSPEVGQKAEALTLQNGRYPTIDQFLQNKIPIDQINPAELATYAPRDAMYPAKVLRGTAAFVTDPATKAAALALGQQAANNPPVPSGFGGVTALGPSNKAAAQLLPLKVVEGTAVAVDQVITEGLDNTPWWSLEGALVGNPKLRRVPDAVSFMMQLPPQLSGGMLKTAAGDPVTLRLNVGLSTLSQGSSHQNTVEPTGTGLLVNFWDSKPDIITASGTTGVFMNQFGLTSIMSANGSLSALGLLDVATAAYQGSGRVLDAKSAQAKDKFRVAAQDAFVELLALFKCNGVIRYTPMPSIASPVNGKGQTRAGNEQQWSSALGLSGYQMRYRVGDVMNSGYVVMNYKGRVLLGQFKSFDWTANAESPYRWDFNFTFRVMSDYIPYLVGGL